MPIVPKPRGNDTSNDQEKSDDGGDEPTFGDHMTHPSLKKAIIEYQKWVGENYPIDIDLSDVDTEISNKMKRTAGKVASYTNQGKVTYIRYAFKAYQQWGWEKFAETIRHELIHVHTVQNHRKGGHGRLFKQKVDALETHRHCEKFANDEAKYFLNCNGCGETVDVRFRDCKMTDQNARGVRSNCCSAEIDVVRNK